MPDMTIWVASRLIDVGNLIRLVGVALMKQGEHMLETWRKRHA